MAGDWDWCRLRAVCTAETRRVLGSSDAVQDATQEALMRAWRQQSTCLTPADPIPWVRAIARREALRISARRTEAPLDTDAEPGTTSDLDRSIGAIDLDRALDALGAAERSVLVLRYWEDLTQAEAARRLDIPAGTARVRLHRARARLRGHLEDYAES